MSKKLWVEYEAPERKYGPAKVFYGQYDKDVACQDVDDFLDRIKAKFEIPGPSTKLNLYQADRTTKIESTTMLSSLGTAGEDGGAPLVVKTIDNNALKCT
jgi:hypothetical protein